MQWDFRVNYTYKEMFFNRTVYTLSWIILCDINAAKI